MRQKMIVAISLLLSLPSQANAKDERPPATTPAVVDILRCRAIPKADKRVACYDAAAGALATAVEQRSIVVLDREEVKQTRRSLFGFSLPKLSLFGGHAGDEEPKAEEIRQVDSTIARFAQAGFGFWTLTLADGSVWRTIEANRNFFPKAGQVITIKRGSFGNYLAAIRNQPTLRVTRVG